jgi:creatinine amidohydrolase
MNKIFLLLVWLFPLVLSGQKDPASLPVKYEELTAPDFVNAVSRAKGIVVIPLGILEKHGPHMPLGTDLLTVRNIAVQAAKKEYVVVFPEYYFGQINEARHQPGTIAYSPKLVWDMLQETCDELARNGFTKIVLVNGHGGNNDFLKYFVFCQNAAEHPYGLYLYQPREDSLIHAESEKMVRSRVPENHAGEREASEMMYIRPDLVFPTRAGNQDGQDQARMTNLPDFYTSLWWYASYPNHYSGDGSAANQELGKFLVENQILKLASSLKEVKSDTTLMYLHEQFNREVKQPVRTKQ